MKTKEVYIPSVHDEFGDKYTVPVVIETLVAAKVLEDRSWHNDACPRFMVGISVFCLWVDAPVPSDREMGGDCPRFRFSNEIDDEGTHEFKGMLETDDLDEVLREITRILKLCAD